jgi:hypothetical protein
MKKLTPLLAALTLSAVSAFAQQNAGGSFTFTPSTQNVLSNSSFTITVGYSGTTPPANIASYDLYLVTAAGNASLFKITANSAGTPFTNPSGSFPAGGSSFGTTGAAAGFAINTTDLGFGGTAQNAPYNFTSLATLTISTGALTPNTVYTFFSSTAATTGASGLFSDVGDNNGTVFATPQSTFSITAVVPEPSTVTLLGIAFGAIGFSAFRRSRNRSAAQSS